MPILYYVPIIHSIQDYGSLKSPIQKAFMEQLGETAFNRLQKNINEFWEIVEKRIEEKITEMQGLIIYHDSFPVGDRKKVLALFGHMRQDNPESPNFRLIKKLIDQGAMLVGTEDMNLILKQLKLYQLAAEAGSREEQKKILAANALCSQEITKLRDEFIAKRINETLPELGQGILFIGRDHDVISQLHKLARKIEIVHL